MFYSQKAISPQLKLRAELRLNVPSGNIMSIKFVFGSINFVLVDYIGLKMVNKSITNVEIKSANLRIW